MGNLADIITCAKFQDDIFRRYNFTGIDFPIFQLIFAWTLQQCSATALPVIVYWTRYVVLCQQLRAELVAEADWDARVNHMIATLVSAGIAAAEASSHLRRAVTSFYRKIIIAKCYRPASVLRESTRVTLVRAEESARQVESLGEDYGLRAVCDGPVDVHVMQGTHDSFVTGSDTSTQIARLFDSLV